MQIMWLKTELLHPVDKGGKIRTYHMLKHLKRDHQIIYVTLDAGDAAADASERAVEYCDQLIRIPHRVRQKFTPVFYVELALNVASPLPYFMQKYRSPEMRAAISDIIHRSRPDIVICDFLMPAVNIDDRLPAVRVLFQHNVEAKIWRRHYEVQRNRVKKAYLYAEWRKTRNYEAAACRRFDHVIAVSAQDRETMMKEYGLDNVSDVPTGVDTEYFHPRQTLAPKPHSLVFTGSMDWLPNEDGIIFFLEQVLPIVKTALPAVTLTVVGRNPSRALREIARRVDGVLVTGRVDDVRPYLESAVAYVVPIRIGGGTRLKIYEAMAMDKPVVSTTVGAEGLPLRDGIDLLLADSPDAFATAVVNVLTDPNIASKIGTAAGAMVRAQFGWDKVAARFVNICDDVIRHREHEQSQV